MDYLREIVEENDEAQAVFSSSTRDEIQESITTSSVAVRQMSIESIGEERYQTPMHSVKSLELKTTSTTTLTIPQTPPVEAFSTPLEDGSVGLDIDQPDSVLLPVITPTHQYQAATASCLLKQEFPRTTTATTTTPVVRTDPVKTTTAFGDTTTATTTTTKVELKIGPQHFELLKLLGEGAFGKVILVQSRLNSKELYAMKVISKRLLKKKNNISYMKSERDILTKVNHPFLVSLCFAFQSSTKLFLVMQFLPGGELFLHLRRRGIILEREVQFYLGEMIIAIDFLHNQGIIHRDLKPENILLRKDAHVCITDFGLAKEIGGGGSDGKATRTLCGTSEYMAPEMLTRNGYGKQVDWWALGALCYEMLVGNPPFTAKTQKDLDKKILTEKISLPPYLTAAAHALLRGMLEKDMNKRLGCAKSTMFSIGGVTQLKQHEFFQGLHWQKLANQEITPPIDLRKTNYATAAEVAAAAAAAAAAAGTSNKTIALQQQLQSQGKKQGEPSPVRKDKGNNVNAVGSTSGTTVVTEKKNDLWDEKRTEGTQATAIEEESKGYPPQPAKQEQPPPPPAQSREDEIDDFVSNLRFFATEFTTQVLSRSLVEDTLTPMTGTTATHTPRPESPTAGMEGLDNNDQEMFANFEYMNEQVTYSQQQIEEFEELLKLKQRQAQKKKLLKQKKEELKSKEEEETKKQLLLLQQRQEEEKKQQQKIQQAQQTIKQLQQREHNRTKERNRLATERQSWQEQKALLIEQLTSHQKKLKNVNKKLRDIQELKEKLGKSDQKKVADKDQQQKLLKEPSLVAEAATLTEEEKPFLQQLEQWEASWKGFEEKEKEILEQQEKEEKEDRIEGEQVELILLKKKDTEQPPPPPPSSFSTAIDPPLKSDPAAEPSKQQQPPPPQAQQISLKPQNKLFHAATAATPSNPSLSDTTISSIMKQNPTTATSTTATATASDNKSSSSSISPTISAITTAAATTTAEGAKKTWSSSLFAAKTSNTTTSTAATATPPPPPPPSMTPVPAANKTSAVSTTDADNKKTEKKVSAAEEVWETIPVSGKKKPSATKSNNNNNNNNQKK